MFRFSLLLLAVVACSKTAEETDIGTDGDADTDADTDTDADSDTDTDADAACPPYMGFDKAGTVWEYETNDAFEAENDLSGGWTMTLAQIKLDATTGKTAVYMDIAGWYADSDTFQDFLWTGTIDFHCDADGVWMDGNYTEVDYTYAGETVSQDSWVDYDQPPLVLARSARPGLTWTSEVTGTTESSVTPPQKIAWTVDYEVTAEKSVTVPAGTYTAIGLRSVTDYGTDAAPFTAQSWSDRDVGDVLDSSGQLISWTP